MGYLKDGLMSGNLKPDISGNTGIHVTMNGKWVSEYAFFWATGLAGGLTGNNQNVGIHFLASRSDGKYGNSSTVQPPAFQILMIIKA